MNPQTALRRYRTALGLFIVGLVLSGVTAFPLLHEVEMLARFLHIPADAAPAAHSGLQSWVATVRDGLRATYDAYPWQA